MLYVRRIRQEFRIGIAVFLHLGRFGRRRALLGIKRSRGSHIWPRRENTGTACGKLDLHTLENQETRHTEIFLLLLNTFLALDLLLLLLEALLQLQLLLRLNTLLALDLLLLLVVDIEQVGT
jgi:hypothetical protein